MTDYSAMQRITKLSNKPRLVFSFTFLILIFPWTVQHWTLDRKIEVSEQAADSGSITAKVKSREKKQKTNHHDFPFTDFTPHVLQLLQSVDFNGGSRARRARIDLTVSKPFSVPRVDCEEDFSLAPNLIDAWWCTAFKKIFMKKKQVLPGNVSVSICRGDRMSPDDEFKCFGSSATGGEFCMMNFLEMKRMREGTVYPIIPWKNRSSIPIWRGKPWIRQGNDVNDLTKVVENALARSPRLRAVAYSFDHPKLLDAKIGRSYDHPYWLEREKNGLVKFFPEESFIEQDTYYTKYQVALVLGGIGAAFRTPIHLSTETAIVLQEFEFKEWFTPMMIPFKHYIPLREDLSDLDQKMRWVADHPKEVRQIARNGLKFYEKYLSFKKNEAHIAELVYRMAMLKRERESNHTRIA